MWQAATPKRLLTIGYSCTFACSPNSSIKVTRLVQGPNSTVLVLRDGAYQYARDVVALEQDKTDHQQLEDHQSCNDVGKHLPPHLCTQPT